MGKHLQLMGVIAGSVVLGIVIAVLVSWKLGLLVAVVGGFGGFLMLLKNMAKMMKNPSKMLGNDPFKNFDI